MLEIDSNKVKTGTNNTHRNTKNHKKMEAIAKSMYRTAEHKQLGVKMSKNVCDRYLKKKWRTIIAIKMESLATFACTVALVNSAIRYRRSSAGHMRKAQGEEKALCHNRVNALAAKTIPHRKQHKEADIATCRMNPWTFN